MVSCLKRAGFGRDPFLPERDRPNGKGAPLGLNTVVNVLNIPASTPVWAVYVGMNWLLAAFIAIRYGASRLKCAKS